MRYQVFQAEEGDVEFEQDEHGDVLVDELTGLAVVPPVIGE